MRISGLVKLVSAAVLTGALVLTGAAPAQAVYPPAPPLMTASNMSASGQVSVGITGATLTSASQVTAKYGSKSTTGPVTVAADGSGTASLNVAPLLPKTAGRYDVSFNLIGTSVSTSKTYTVGTAVPIKSFKVVRKSNGYSISGKAIKGLKVKVTVKIGSRSYSKTQKTTKSGSFSWKYKGTKKGTYTVTAKIIPTTKYFGDFVASKVVKRK